MSRALGITVVVLLAAAASYLVWGGGDADRPQPFPAFPKFPDEVESRGNELTASDGRQSVDRPADTPSRNTEAPAVARITGRVIDPSGVPIRDVTVRFDPRWQRGRTAPARTDADGYFRLGTTEARRIALRLRHPAYAPLFFEQATVIAADDSVDVGEIQMLRGGRAIGRVADSGELGIAGAEIRLRPLSSNALAMATDLAAVLPPVLSDANGQFTFQHVPPGGYRVEAVASGWQRTRVTEPTEILSDADTDLGTIRLERGYRIEGVVRDPAGQPVAGARIDVGNEPDRRDELFVRQRERSGEDGRFAVDHLPPAHVIVRVSSKGLQTWVSEPVFTPEAVPLRVNLTEGLRVQGVVVDAASGQPVTLYAAKIRRLGASQEEQFRERIDSLRTKLTAAGDDEAAKRLLQAQLEVLDHAQRRLAEQNRQPTRVPGDVGQPTEHQDGMFEFEELDVGRYAVDVISPEHQYARSSVFELTANGPPPTVQIALQRGTDIVGTVVGSGGDPVPGASVELRRESEGRVTRPQHLVARGRRGTTLMSTRTDEAGSFRLANAAGNRLFLRARHHEYTDTETELFDLAGSDRGTFQITLESAAILDGQILGVSAEQQRQTRVLAFGGFGRMKTVGVNETGRYELVGLQAGSYLVRAFVGDLRTYMAAHLELFENAPDQLPFDLQLAPGEHRSLDLTAERIPMGGVRGIATRDGAPAADYRVSLRAARSPDAAAVQMRLGSNIVKSARTDAEGRFEIEDLNVGLWHVMLMHDRGERVELAQTTIQVVDSGFAEVRLDASTTTLEGTVRTADGESPDGLVEIHLGVTSLPQPPLERRPLRLRVHDGRFFSSNVPAGPAVLVVTVGTQRSEPVATVLNAGQKSSIDVDF